MAIEIKVPALGESVTEATLGKWFKKAGDAVAVDEPLCELETDKVTVEVPSPAAGTLADIRVEEGATVAVGSVLGSIKEGAAVAAAPKPAPSQAATKPNASPPSASPAPARPAAPAAAPSQMPPSPAARKILEEKGVAAEDVAG
ncbi:MAG: biotin/lipoyl-containing protein, partial [Hyphomicrobiaceae bacterium]